MDVTNIRVIFSVYADDYDINEFTNRIGLIPNTIWNKGSKNEGGIPRNFAYWGINTEYQSSLAINNQVHEILSKLTDRVDQLVSLKKIFELDYELSVVVNIVNNQPPSMCIESDVIEFMAKIGASLDIDTYIFN